QHERRRGRHQAPARQDRRGLRAQAAAHDPRHGLRARGARRGVPARRGGRLVKLSISQRLVLMFAVGALAAFSLIGIALYGVPEREMTRHQDNELNTNLQNLRYSIERFGNLERWARLQAKMDTLTPRDGSVRFWVLSDDPRFQYGQGLDQIDRIS